VLRDELREQLRELAEATGALSVAICHDESGGSSGQLAGASIGPVSDDGDHVEVTVPVGGGASLWARYHRTDGEPARTSDDRLAALERTARALRACARRWDVPSLPPLLYPDRSPGGTRQRVIERVEAYLQALAATHGVVNAIVTHRGHPLASAFPLTELQRERLPFTLKRVKAEAARLEGSSHAYIAGDDFFAQSFWFEACLIAFFAGPYAVDFVRHRARLVTRELANLLPLLDDPDHDPAIVAPLPE
jgi:hypothetical protein